MNMKAVELLNLIASVTEEEAGAIAVLCEGSALHRAIYRTKGIMPESAQAEETEKETTSLPKRTGYLLKRLGVPMHIYGFGYLQTAIEAVVGNPDMIHATTKELYPVVAKTHFTTPSRVERSIRHAIEIAYSRGNYDLLGKVIPSVDASKGKATNAEFIAALAEYLRGQM